MINHCVKLIFFFMAFRNFIPPREESFMEVQELSETPKVTKNGIDVEITTSNEIADLPDYRCYNADVLESAGVPLSRVSCSLLAPDAEDVIRSMEDITSDSSLEPQN